VWTISLPSVLSAADAEQRSGANARAWQSIYRASGCLRLSQLLAGRWKDRGQPSRESQMRRLQERFYGELRTADQELRAAGAKADAGAAARRTALVKENQLLFRQTAWDEIRRQTEEMVANLPALSSQTESGQLSPVEESRLHFSFAEQPGQMEVSVTTLASSRQRQAAIATLILTALLGGLLAVYRPQGTKKPLAANSPSTASGASGKPAESGSSAAD
jgi:hypothetical protein